MTTLDGDFTPPSFFRYFWLDNRLTCGGAVALRILPLERGLAMNAGRLCAPDEWNKLNPPFSVHLSNGILIEAAGGRGALSAAVLTYYLFLLKLCCVS